MKTLLLIFPFNGNAIEALDCLNSSYQFLGFVDDDVKKHGESPYGLVMGRSAFELYSEAFVLAVPGNSSNFSSRMSIITSLGLGEDRFVSIIHPRANVSPYAVIGHNVLLMGGVWVSAGASIGNHICVLPNSVIHHDAVVDDHTMIGANVTIAGGVVVGKKCYLGSGVTVRQSTKIAPGSLIGMAANLVCDVEHPGVWAGNPARLLNKG